MKGLLAVIQGSSSLAVEPGSRLPLPTKVGANRVETLRFVWIIRDVMLEHYQNLLQQVGLIACSASLVSGPQLDEWSLAVSSLV